MLNPQQKQNVAEWLFHLDSGKYQQGVNELKNTNDRYCCLGVAVESVLHREFVVYHINCGKENLVYYDNLGMANGSNLGEEDSEALGLHQHLTIADTQKLRDDFVLERMSTCDTREYVCTTLNDEYGYSFTDIASVIRKMGWDNS